MNAVPPASAQQTQRAAPRASGRTRELAALASTVTIGLALAPASSLSQSTATVSAPYQLEGVQLGTRAIGDRSVQALVGMGRAPDPDHPDLEAPIPDADALSWMTLMGTDGWVLASLVSIERRCEFLCSHDGPQECHWVGLYSPGGDISGIGTPLGALAGRVPIEDFRGFSGADADTPPDPMAELETEGDPQELLWEPWPDWRPIYTVETFDLDGGTIALNYEHGDQNGTIEDAGCTPLRREWLLTLNCGSLSLLASGGRPLMLSQADYNAPAAEVLARFDAGGSRHYVVRFGAKAQDVVGLVSGEPGGWVARFRPRDWALLC